VSSDLPLSDLLAPVARVFVGNRIVMTVKKEGDSRFQVEELTA
jgi:hypothetical protein